MSAISTNLVQRGPSFASTLWVQGVLLRLVIGCCMFALTLFQPLPMALLAAIMATDLCGFTWALLKYNTAAGIHLNQTARFWPVVFGFIFFFLAAIAMIVSWWLLMSEAKPPSVFSDEKIQSETQPMPSGERFVADISRDRSQIYFKGVVAHGLAVEFEPWFLESDRVETLVLHSPGGNVHEARVLAEDIQRRGLNTHVTNECSASCLLLYMAGTNRTLGAGGQLGFHRYGLDFVQVLPHVNPLREMPIDQQYYLKRGVSMDFLDKVFDLNREAIWYPSRRELMDAGIVTQ